MKSLIDILNESRKHFPGLGKRLKEAESLGLWEKAVGPIIAKHTRALKVQDEVLWVQVDHPIWKSELHHRKRQILEILNRTQEGGELSTLKDILFLDKR
jgi:predicted nucleic acid-binding Zn ribbon protein